MCVWVCAVGFPAAVNLFPGTSMDTIDRRSPRRSSPVLNKVHYGCPAVFGRLPVFGLTLSLLWHSLSISSPAPS